MALPPTGTQFEISGGGYRAVVTESGATLRGLWRDDWAIVHGFDEDELPHGGSGQVLMPWPNRIGNGRYDFNGSPYQLALTEPKLNNAIHGLVRWATWVVKEHTSDSVTLAHRLMAQSGYPWTLDLEVTYALGDDGLTVSTTALNRATTAAPFAYGAHPYVDAGGPLDDWTLVLPAAAVATVDEQMLPMRVGSVDGTRYDFRDGKPIGDLQLDHGFTDVAHVDGRALVTVHGLRGAVTVWGDEHITCLQVFSGDSRTPPRQALAIEPMTAMADAFRHGEGFDVLPPNASIAIAWGISVR